MTAYYNDNDPFAAAWLRELVWAGHIPWGDVDERSILDVGPDDLAGYDQCHFFAGIGGWAQALKLAGWPEHRPVWTASLPCQPFSAAGRGGGFADERHLWPHFFRLVAECRPSVCFGEQVASKAGLEWLDHIQADLEGADYACGAVDLSVAGIGAPHIRQRLYGVADTDDAGFQKRERDGGISRIQGGASARQIPAVDSAPDGRLADADDPRPQGRDVGGDGAAQRPAGAGGVDGRMANAVPAGRPEGWTGAGNRSVAGIGSAVGMADAGGQGEGGRRVLGPGQGDGAGAGSARQRPPGLRTDGNAGPISASHWQAADWLFCRDGKWRPVEPGTFPLAHGLSQRVGRLRGYGNAIVPQIAAEIVNAYIDTRKGCRQ